MIQNQSLKKKQDRKIVGKREKWMLRICSKCPLPHTDWKIFLCCLRPGKKRWANNESQISIYKRSDLPASWESLAFTAHQPGHSLAALQTMCLLCSSLPELLFWGLCLMQAPGVRQAPGNVALPQSLWLHWTAAQKHLAVGAPAQFFSAYSSNTKHLQHRYPSGYWRNIP